jgi:hypothetical protein
MIRILLVLSLLVPLAAQAQEPASGTCTYEDLHGKFSLTTDCAGLRDHSGLGQKHKRMWLAGDWGQLQIMELSPPHRTNESLDFVMDNIGRDWGRRTIGKKSEMSIHGSEGRVVTERKLRTTSRSWLFRMDGVNVLAYGVAFGKRAEREENLERISKAFLEGLARN